MLRRALVFLGMVLLAVALIVRCQHPDEGWERGSPTGFVIVLVGAELLSLAVASRLRSVGASAVFLVAWVAAAAMLVGASSGPIPAGAVLALVLGSLAAAAADRVASAPNS
jgi:peptidoglycan/LPS O-acetylase OafA/YrhL